MTEPRIPEHIAIIMDGNNRWAKRHGKRKLLGHAAGADALRRVIRKCIERGVRTLSVFAFSSENWSRPKLEVDGLMRLFEKSLEALGHAFAKIRTGRAHPSILDAVRVDYYGSDVPVSQVANISVEDARTLAVTPWEKSMVGEIEKAIMKSDLGLNPATAGEVIRVPMPALTEETRKGYTKQARAEAEQSKVSVRNIRRDALADVKELLKEKEITEDDDRRAGDEIQKLTDDMVKRIDQLLQDKEADLMEV